MQLSCGVIGASTISCLTSLTFFCFSLSHSFFNSLSLSSLLYHSMNWCKILAKVSLTFIYEMKLSFCNLCKWQKYHGLLMFIRKTSYNYGNWYSFLTLSNPTSIKNHLNVYLCKVTLSMFKNTLSSLNEHFLKHLFLYMSVYEWIDKEVIPFS